MVDTIEAFVEKLQSDGVQAGQAAADQLSADAKTQAEGIISDARAQADAIIADATTQAASIISRGKSELALAARDTLGTLRQNLIDALNGLLAAAARDAMQQPDFMKQAILDVVNAYAAADQVDAEINVSSELASQLKEWAMTTLGKDVRSGGPALGFDYAIDGATVEINPESVVAMVSDMVTPALRETLIQAKSE
jgi:vacuolar-type H+-ATPase subunit H